jgi:hypothetical protein
MNKGESATFVDFMHAKGFLAKAGVVVNAFLNIVLGKPDTTNYAGDRILYTASSPNGIPSPAKPIIVNHKK